jgi:aminoglycoside phosphotransferase (APT) family kinase protein
MAMIGWVDGNYYTVEQRLPALHAITVSDHAYGQALRLEQSLSAPTWPAFLRASAERQLACAAAHLRRDVQGLDQKLVRFFPILATLPTDPPKALVHGDYYLGNVLFDEAGRLAAVLDFSPHTVVGDPLLDVAGAVSFLTLSSHITPVEVDHLSERAVARYGLEMEQRLASMRSTTASTSRHGRATSPPTPAASSICATRRCGRGR